MLILTTLILNSLFKVLLNTVYILNLQQKQSKMNYKNGLSRIYIKDILSLINKKDVRSVNSWCKKNNVEIFQDSSGKFVIEAEFSNAYNQPIIFRYKEKYGDNWVHMYELCMENKLYLADEHDQQIRYSGRYQPKSKAAKDFLKQFE